MKIIIYCHVPVPILMLQFDCFMFLSFCFTQYRLYFSTSYIALSFIMCLYFNNGCYCCCSAYLSYCHWTASDANLLDDPHTFHYQDYFVIGGIRTCFGVSDDPMFLWISSNSCPLNLLLVRSHQAEIIIVKRLIQGRNSVTRVRVEPGSFNQGRRKNDAFTHSTTLPTVTRFLSASWFLLAVCFFFF